MIFSRVKFLLSAAFACAALLVAGPSAIAAPITAGQTLLATGEVEPTAGTAIDTVTDIFSTPLYSGSATSWVIQGDTSNPYIGGLTFLYQFELDAGSADTLKRFTVNSFVGFLTDVAYQIPTNDVIPLLVDRDASGTIGFSFFGAPVGNGTVGAGQSSALLIIQTNATEYKTTIASVIDGRVNEVSSFAPRTSGDVPEPATIALAATGLIGLVALRLRRRR